LNDPLAMIEMQASVHHLAKERFSPKRILAEWEKLFNDL
jgi:hypothetical protein